MTELLLLVEGQTEEAFVKRLLAPHLSSFGLAAKPVMLRTRRLPGGGGYPGGVTSWAKIRRDLLPLTGHGAAWVTTILDYYGLPQDVPGVAEARAAPLPTEGVAALEARIEAEIGHRRFIPFFALHELEAWLFADPDRVAEHFGSPGAGALAEIVVCAGGPEQINHGRQTHPKERLRQFAPSYKATSDGPTLLEKIGLDRIRATCPHFGRWLTRLESLESGGPRDGA